MARRLVWFLIIAELGLAALAFVLAARAPLVAHAGGFLDGEPYTNSFEAFERSVARGVDMIEVDFDFTVEADGTRTLVCVHDWDDFGGTAPSLADWRASAPAGQTPCEADSLAAWLEKNADVIIVTDVKAKDHEDALRALSAAGLKPERTIVQIYDPSEAAMTARAGFDRRWITLYRYKGEPGPIRALSDQGAVEAVVMHEGLVAHGWIGKVGDVPVYVHTINGPVRAAILALRGTDGFYTDVTTGPWWHPFAW